MAAVASLIGVADAPRKSRKVATDEELASPYRGRRCCGASMRCRRC
ncbi:conserved integral membrane transport domain protein [Mycobacterium kansasii]|uniref:Conserved integral membrane transport domain protein n=1 Tax=Mycobacterium kansasii TaxID=1768 RepID=A0A1V3XTY5_MYCKA|nr:conserved integral membrane transport domain protein [Mycobacterium kansasii]